MQMEHRHRRSRLLLCELQTWQRCLRVAQKAETNAVRSLRSKLVAYETLYLKVLNGERSLRARMLEQQSQPSHAHAHSTSTAVSVSDPFGYVKTQQLRELALTLRAHTSPLAQALALCSYNGNNNVGLNDTQKNSSDKTERKQTEALARAVVCDLYGKAHERALLYMLREMCACLHALHTQTYVNADAHAHAHSTHKDTRERTHKTNKQACVALDFNSLSLKIVQEYNQVAFVCLLFAVCACVCS